MHRRCCCAPLTYSLGTIALSFLLAGTCRRCAAALLRAARSWLGLSGTWRCASRAATTATSTPLRCRVGSGLVCLLPASSHGGGDICLPHDACLHRFAGCCLVALRAAERSALQPPNLLPLLIPSTCRFALSLTCPAAAAAAKAREAFEAGAHRHGFTFTHLPKVAGDTAAKEQLRNAGAC